MDVLGGLTSGSGGVGDHGWWVAPRPFDMSYAPPEFPMGLTMVHWLNERLACYARDHCRLTPAQASDQSQSFDRVSHGYFRGSAGFNQFVRDLSVSVHGYAAAASEEIRLRLSLMKDLGEWLELQATLLNVKGFVVALDDVDLPPANHHQSLVWSLLDELHQPRLFILLAGELQRLERRLAQEDADSRGRFKTAPGDRGLDLDLQTAADLVYKVLPQVDRIELEPWSAEDRMAFVSPVEDHQTELSAAPSISDLLTDVAPGDVLHQHAEALLPEWPRGLENVHRELQRLAKQQAQANQEENAVQMEELVAFLAESTFDFELARALRRRPLERWAGTFQWAESSQAPDATWRRVRSSLAGNLDIPELTPAIESMEIPLGGKRVRWVELLIDMALQAGVLSPLRLIRSIPWVRDRIAACERTFTLGSDSFLKSQEDETTAFLGALYWLRCEPSEQSRNFRVAAGVWPLLELLRGARSSWPSFLTALSQTPVPVLPESELDERASKDRVPPEFMNDLAEGRPIVQEHDLLPRSLRGILEFVDTVASEDWAAVTRAGQQYQDYQVTYLARTAAITTLHGIGRAVLGDRVQAASPLSDSDPSGPRETPRQVLGRQRADYRKLLKKVTKRNEQDAASHSPGPDLLKTYLDAPWLVALCHGLDDTDA
ncbi:MAG: hypothetical protein AAGG01_11230 [Planctomycetota bacterium]